MPAFQYGLCALPVDGALHRGDGTVSARVKAVLAAVRKRGAAVVVATGLSSVAARRVPQDLEGEIDYIVCGNGSHIYRIEHDGPAAGLARKQWIEHAEPLAMPLDTVERIQDLLSEAFPDSIFSANFCPPLNTLGEPTEAVTDIKKAKQILAFSLAPATVETIVADMIESSPVHLASPHPLIQLSIGFPGVEDAQTNKLHGDELHGDVRTNAFMEQVKDVLAAADLPGWD
jgi:hydroxymethylpyrimidine pyrophosphatase-like HAD family hydrolase